jgi:hypothetical protein
LPLLINDSVAAVGAVAAAQQVGTEHVEARRVACLWLSDDTVAADALRPAVLAAAVAADRHTELAELTVSGGGAVCRGHVERGDAQAVRAGIEAAQTVRVSRRTWVVVVAVEELVVLKRGTVEVCTLATIVTLLSGQALRDHGDLSHNAISTLWAEWIPLEGGVAVGELLAAEEVQSAERSASTDDLAGDVELDHRVLRVELKDAPGNAEAIVAVAIELVLPEGGCSAVVRVNPAVQGLGLDSAAELHGAIVV